MMTIDELREFIALSVSKEVVATGVQIVIHGAVTGRSKNTSLTCRNRIPISVTPGDAVPQLLAHACGVAAWYRGERRCKVLFQQCQIRLVGQVNRSPAG